MTLSPGNDDNKRRRLVGYTLIGVIGQVGCITILIILGAVFAGIWLDQRFQTNNILTFILVIASIPISLLVMFFVVRMGLARIKPQITTEKQGEEEANLGGKHS